MRDTSLEYRVMKILRTTSNMQIHTNMHNLYEQAHQSFGDVVGPSLVRRPSPRETTCGFPESCCCNTKSSWSNSGIKTVFIEFWMLFESSVPPDNVTKN